MVNLSKITMQEGRSDVLKKLVNLSMYLACSSANFRSCKLFSLSCSKYLICESEINLYGHLILNTKWDYTCA